MSRPISSTSQESYIYPEYPAYPCFKFFNEIQYLLSPGIKTGLIYVMELYGYCKCFYFNRDIQDGHDKMIFWLFVRPCGICDELSCHVWLRLISLRFGSSRRRQRNVANKFEFVTVTASLVNKL